MEPYDALPGVDRFAAAARAFGRLTEELADPASAALTHHDLEDLIEARGRELSRRFALAEPGAFGVPDSDLEPCETAVSAVIQHDRVDFAGHRIPHMPMSRLSSSVVMLVGVALLAGCGTGGDGRPAASAPGGGPRAGAASTAQPARWTYEYVSNRTAFGNEAFDIAAVSPRDAWALAVRQDARAGRPALQMLRFDGSRWQEYDVLADLRDALDGGTISASSTLHAGGGSVWLFAQADHGPGSRSTALTARFDGDRWRVVEVPRVGRVNAVAVLGPSDVWVLGEHKERTASHWDGRSWTATRLPLEPQAITAQTAGGDPWVVGDTPNPAADLADKPDPGHPKPRPLRLAAARWDGLRWREERMPDVDKDDARYPGCRTPVHSLMARAADDVWAMGIEYGPYTGPRYTPPGDRPCALHWDGEEWSKSSELPAGILDARRVRGEDGKVTRIARPAYLAGVTGKVSEADRKQVFRLSEIAAVPGTDEAWGVGKAELGASGDANFSRAVIVRYRP
ncbi:hypothetical protein [Streptomyces longispororuber]|uniref:hypothetical protein n=1 Tax=Streptomyces longispororuber TaxID=68230 RepID=UPI00210E995F|nr:hypothetical protein [Streptomyces longispororuber]MCQ4206452.1 hypothetical protein [Streptomyces longispororuber]